MNHKYRDELEEHLRQWYREKYANGYEPSFSGPDSKRGCVFLFKNGVGLDPLPTFEYMNGEPAVSIAIDEWKARTP